MKPPIRRRRHPAPAPATTANPKIDMYLSRSSSLAQIIAVLLAGFGYFYTVLPVFQNQKLQEDNAQLQMSNAKLQEDTKREESKLKNLATDLSTQTKKLESVQLSLEQDRQNLIEVSAKLKGAELGEKSAKKAATQANEKLKTELSKLDVARWKIVMMNFSQLAYMSSLWDDKLSDALYKKNSEDDSFILDAEKAWPKTLPSIRSALDIARQRSQEIPKNYYDKIEKHIEEHAHQLVCPKPDIKKLAKQFNHEYKDIDVLAKADATADIDRQRKAAESEGSTLLVRKGDMEKIAEGYKIGRNYSLRAKYREIINKESEACGEIIHNYIKSIRKDLNLPSETN